MHKRICISVFVLSIANIIYAQTTNFKFEFGTDKPQKGLIGINASSIYSKTVGYGFLQTGAIIENSPRSTSANSSAHFCTADKPFFFKVDLPEGNYDVKITLGDPNGNSLTTVKVENRRLMLEKIKTDTSKIGNSKPLIQHLFTVNVRNANINGKDSVKLKPRERDYLHWDNALTFEFCDAQPKIVALEITPNSAATTVFLAGNSTVVDQYIEPFAAWGQMLPRFFEPLSIAIANHAESGETLRSFVSEKRLDKVLSLMKTGDYMFIEFAHNDQKQKDLNPFGGYKDLLKKFIQKARAKGGKPILVTSMHRRSFDSVGHLINTLGDFPEAVRQTAQEENVPLIDLNAMSKTLWEALGAEGAKKAFVHVAANTFPSQDKAIQDDTHFSNYGAYLLTLCMVEGIKQNVPDLARFLQKDIPHFNPSVPLPFESFHFPMGISKPIVVPDGN